MGYCITQNDSKFHIKRKNLKKAYKAAISMTGNFSWVEKGWQKNCRNIFEVLYEWGYEAKVDADGSIIDINFISEKLGHDLCLFRVIAPFVEEDSYIEMYGEDNNSWRWIFRNGKCEEIQPKILW